MFFKTKFGVFLMKFVVNKNEFCMFNSYLYHTYSSKIVYLSDKLDPVDILIVHLCDGWQ